MSPTRNVIHTCDPETSAQIFRRNEFGKPVELIELLNIFGPGLTGSDGPVGRLYRKITAPFFTERTMDQVWTISLDSAGALMEGLITSQTSEPGTTLRSNIANMSLHNLTTVCFERNPNAVKKFQLHESIPAGHDMSFRQTVLSVLDHIGAIAFTSKFLLSLCLSFPVAFISNQTSDYSPLKNHRKAYQSFSGLQKYLEDLQKGASNDNKSHKPAATKATLLGESSIIFTKPSNLSLNRLIGSGSTSFQSYNRQLLQLHVRWP